MMKIWTYAFWGAPRRGDGRTRAGAAVAAPTAVLVAGDRARSACGAQPFLRLADDAADEIVTPDAPTSTRCCGAGAPPRSAERGAR